MTGKTPEAVKYRRPNCSTGKLGWDTRRGAKAFNNRIVRSGGDRLNPYKCKECAYWHLGHLPQIVKRGDVGRTEHYNAIAKISDVQAKTAPNSQESDRRSA